MNNRVSGQNLNGLCTVYSPMIDESKERLAHERERSSVAHRASSGTVEGFKPSFTAAL
jgi:hypothetical protein